MYVWDYVYMYACMYVCMSETMCVTSYEMWQHKRNRATVVRNRCVLFPKPFDAPRLSRCSGWLGRKLVKVAKNYRVPPSFHMRKANQNVHTFSSKKYLTYSHLRCLNTALVNPARAASPWKPSTCPTAQEVHACKASTLQHRCSLWVMHYVHTRTHSNTGARLESHVTHIHTHWRRCSSWIKRYVHTHWRRCSFWIALYVHTHTHTDAGARF